jgi:hypothetical protein
MFVTAFCKVYVIWTFHCTGNKTFVKVNQWFLLYLESSILREVSACPQGPKAVLFRLAKFLFEALGTHDTHPQ